MQTIMATAKAITAPEPAWAMTSEPITNTDAAGVMPETVRKRAPGRRIALSRGGARGGSPMGATEAATG